MRKSTHLFPDPVSPYPSPANRMAAAFAPDPPPPLTWWQKLGYQIHKAPALLSLLLELATLKFQLRKYAAIFEALHLIALCKDCRAKVLQTLDPTKEEDTLP